MARNKKLVTSVVWDVVEKLPVSLPAGLAVFSIGIMTLLLLGQLHSWLVILVAVPLGLAASWYASSQYNSPKFPGGNKEKKYVSLAVLVGVMLWVGFNSFYTAQNIFIYRDPAIYTVNGAWLIDNHHIEITASDVFGDNPEIKGDGVSLGPIKDGDEDRLYVHGGQLLPALLGLLGRLGGESFMMRMGPLFGGFALLALFGFSKLIIKPRWAAFATLAMAISLPMIYFSRDTYTEPLSMALFFGGLSLVWMAHKNKLSIRFWLLAGIAVGATTLTRIDAYLGLAGFILFVFIRPVFAETKDKSYVSKTTLSFLVGIITTALLGWLAFTELGAKYYHDLRSGFMQQMHLLFIISIVGLIFILAARQKTLLKRLDKLTRSWRGPVLVLALLAAVAFLASRPFWQIVYARGQNPIVAILQEAATKPVEPRTYAEQSANWIWWYIGPVISLFAIHGFILAGYKSMTRRKNAHLLLPLLVVGITAAVYLIRPAITPDQIWAVRRFLPVILPGLCFFAAYSLQYIYEKHSFRLKKLILTGVMTLSFGPIVFISWPFLTTRTFQNQLDHVYEVCDSLPDNAAVLLVGNNGFNMMQAIRTFCDVPAQWTRDTSRLVLSEAHQEATINGYIPVLHIIHEDLPLLPEGTYVTPVSITEYDDLIKNLYNPPRGLMTEGRTIFLGTIDQNGEINPL